MKAKCEETHDVEKEILQLINQGSSLAVEPGGLKNADIPNGNTEHLGENLLSYDFEGLRIKEEKYNSKYEQVVVRIH